MRTTVSPHFRRLVHAKALDLIDSFVHANYPGDAFTGIVPSQLLHLASLPYIRTSCKHAYSGFWLNLCFEFQGDDDDNEHTFDNSSHELKPVFDWIHTLLLPAHTLFSH